MLISLFTPTHKPVHIRDTYASLLSQSSNVQFEWIIVPNGSAKPEDIPGPIAEDKRVKIIPTDKKGIGALKHFACHQCSGDIFVELDHDDQLTPDAFEELEKAYTQAPNGFYYSDFINVKPDGSCETYKRTFGWETYPCKVNGKSYTANRAFKPSARSICQIYYAPNHVRAWSKRAYLTTKGHDPALFVGDDHDLVCRTYLSGAPFIYIEKPIYVYRRYTENSFVLHNKEIQIQQTVNMNKYLHNLVYEECRRHKSTMIDLVNSNKIDHNFVIIELSSCLNALKNIESASVGCVRAFDVLQKISTRDVVPLFNELYRILSPGGWLLTATPSIDDGKGKPGRGAFQDPTHQSYWSENNFAYFTNEKFASLITDREAKFQQVRLWTGYPSEFHEKNFIPYVYSDMCALKGQRQPGECKI